EGRYRPRERAARSNNRRCAAWRVPPLGPRAPKLASRAAVAHRGLSCGVAARYGFYSAACPAVLNAGREFLTGGDPPRMVRAASGGLKYPEFSALSRVAA